MGVEGNRVYVKTATTGTGTVTLGGAVSSGFTTFAEAGIADGTVVRSYCIEDGGDFEIGTGTYTSAGTTLSRTTVFISKIGGTSGTTKLTLSGNATVRVIAAQEDIVKTTGTNSMAGALTITDSTASTTTATGALIVTGGVGIGGDLNFAGSAWTAYTPTVTANVGTFTTASATGRYKQIGKTVHFAVNVTITTQGTASSAIAVTFPVTASAAAVGAWAGREMTLTGVAVVAFLSSTTTFLIQKYDGTFNGVSGTSFYVSGTYEAA